MKKRSSGVSLFLAAVTLVITSTAFSSHTATPVATTGISAGRTDNVQVADEITRRLRRIGVTFSRSRIPHPYDPAGEVC